MTAVVQSAVSGEPTPSTTVTSWSLAFSSPVTVGNYIVGCLLVGDFATDPSPTVTDNLSNAYTVLSGNAIDTTNAVALKLFWAKVTTGGSCTVDASWSVLGSPAMMLFEVESSGFDAGGFQFDATVSTSSNGITVGATSTVANDVMLSFICNTSASVGETTYANGTGFTGDSSYTWTGYVDAIQSEDGVAGAAGAQTATWTASNSGQSCVIGLMLMKPAAGSHPVNSVAPTISGTLQVGDTLTCNEGTWSPTPSSYLYQWYRATSSGGAGATPISGATSKTYILQSADSGDYISVAVTGEP